MGKIYLRKNKVMANSETIKTIIDANINTNGNQAITGAVMNSVLKQMVDATDAELAELSQEKEDKANKVTSLTDESTDDQYPSAKAVYALKERIEENEVQIADLQNMKIDKEADDYYPQLSVGVADNLAGVDVVDSSFAIRRSGGGAITDGVARVQSIKGNSEVWNQLFFGFIPNSETGTTITQLSNGLYRVEVEQGTNYGGVALRKKAAYEVGHKYAVALELISSVGLNLNAFGEKRSGLTQGTEFICTATTSVLTLLIPSATMAAQAVSFDVGLRITDLTLRFGAGNEPTTIEEFYARIPMGIDLNSYNEGEVIHMDVQSIESVGVNQWDEVLLNEELRSNGTTAASTDRTTTSFIRVLPNATYYLKVPSSNYTAGRQAFYDEDKNLILFEFDGARPNTQFTTPPNAAYMRYCFTQEYGTTYNNDICINLSDASINGKYFPYIKRVENLAFIRNYFPQGMKSAGTAHDEIRYNKQSNKWEAVQRVGEIDFSGARAYTSVENTFLLPIADMKVATTNAERGTGLLCAKYPMHGGGTGYNVVAMSDKSMLRMDNGNIYIKDSAFGSDATAFKAAMAGVMLYYELAEPIVTEIAEPFNLDYKVWNGGTEEVISDAPTTPLKAEITYGFNAIGKIKELESNQGVSKEYVDNAIATAITNELNGDF